MMDMNHLPKKLQLDILKHNVRMVLKRGVRLVQPYDLRTPQYSKHEDTIDCEDWTAFVNRTVTLVHVMRRGCSYALIRIPLKGFKYTNLEKLILHALYENII